MCFWLDEDYKGATAQIKAKGEPIIAYKLLDKNLCSPVYPGEPWEVGKKVRSGRRSAKPTPSETHHGLINRGIHLYRACPYLCLCTRLYRYQYQYPCRCRYRCPCQCLYRCPNGNKRWMKVEIQARSIVAINKDEIVATMCKPIEEVTF
jgi:hypothetical protein